MNPRNKFFSYRCHNLFNAYCMACLMEPGLTGHQHLSDLLHDKKPIIPGTLIQGHKDKAIHGSGDFSISV